MALPRTARAALLSVFLLAAAALAPAASADVVRHPATGFSIQAPSDFQVRFDGDTGRYVIASRRRGVALTYRRVLRGGQRHRIVRIRGGSPRLRTMLRRIAASARGGRVVRLSRRRFASEETAFTVSWIEPAAGATVSGDDVELAVGVSSSSRVRQVDFYVGAVHVGRERYAPYQLDFDSTDFDDGAHELRAVATLDSGATQTARASVTVANADGDDPGSTDPDPEPVPDPAPQPEPDSDPAPAPPPPTGQTLFAGTFEAGTFAGWYVQSLTTRATVVSGGASGSAYAARFEVRDGDVEPDTGSERSEVSLSSPKFDEGQDLYFRDSFMVPNGSSIGSSWQIINQIHEVDFGGSPGIAVFLSSGPSIKIGAGDGSPTFLSGAKIQHDRWHDLVYRVKLSRDPSVGFVEVWLDGVQLKLANGQLRMYGQTIQAARGYLKAGIYRGKSHTGTSVVYHDNLIVGTSLAAVGA